MAEVFSPPLEVGPTPNFSDFITEKGYDLDGLVKAEDEWVEKLAGFCRKHSNSRSDLIGEVIRFPRADGYAMYMVYKLRPLTLIHLPVGDAWRIEEFAERGLRLEDVRQKIESQRALNKIFGRED